MSVSFDFMRRWGLFGLLLAPCFALSAAAQAEQPTQPASPPTAFRSEDEQIASRVYHLFFEEARISRFAAQRAERREVKYFASTLAGNGDEFLSKIMQVVPFSETFGEDPPATTASVSPVELNIEMAHHHVYVLKQYLDKYYGVAFDRAYLSHEIDGQLRTVAQLEVLQKHASPRLEPLIDEGIAMARQNLAQAGQLAWQLRESPPYVVRRPYYDYDHSKKQWHGNQNKTNSQHSTNTGGGKKILNWGH
jgi:predicted outer membrane protein